MALVSPIMKQVCRVRSPVIKPIIQKRHHRRAGPDMLEFLPYTIGAIVFFTAAISGTVGYFISKKFYATDTDIKNESE